MRALLPLVVLLAAGSVAVADPWRVQAHALGHVSASTSYEDNAAVMVGAGLALERRLSGSLARLGLLGSVDVEGSRFPGITRRAIPLMAGARYYVYEGGRAAAFARAGLGVAREWIELSTAAGIYSRDDYRTTRTDLGGGALWRLGRVAIGGELRLVSLTRWDSYGDGPAHRADPEGAIPKQSSGLEIALFLSRRLP